MQLTLETDDIWGLAVAIGLSVALAESSFKNGRDDYRTGFYFCFGNILVSFLIYFMGSGAYTLDFREVFLIVIGSFFAYIGVSATLRRPKNVRCFRCEYVGYPSETTALRTPHHEASWQAFRTLDAEAKRYSISPD